MKQPNKRRNENGHQKSKIHPSLPILPSPNSPTTRENLVEPKVVAANTSNSSNNTDKIKQPQDSITQGIPHSTTISYDSNQVYTRTDIAIIHEPIPTKSRPPRSPNATTAHPPANKHVSTLHRPFRRVRSVPSNANAHDDERVARKDGISNDAADDDGTAHSAALTGKDRRNLERRSDMAKIQRSTSLLTAPNNISSAKAAATKVNTETTAKHTISKNSNKTTKPISSTSITANMQTTNKPKNKNNTTNATNTTHSIHPTSIYGNYDENNNDDDDNDDNDNNDDKRNTRIDITSKKGNQAAEHDATEHPPPTLPSSFLSPLPSAIPSSPPPLPVAEETGPWSVEALDLFDWRPTDWEERMRRVRRGREEREAREAREAREE